MEIIINQYKENKMENALNELLLECNQIKFYIVNTKDGKWIKDKRDDFFKSRYKENLSYYSYLQLLRNKIINELVLKNNDELIELYNN